VLPVHGDPNSPLSCLGLGQGTPSTSLAAMGWEVLPEGHPGPLETKVSDQQGPGIVSSRQPGPLPGPLLLTQQFLPLSLKPLSKLWADLSVAVQFCMPPFPPPQTWEEDSNPEPLDHEFALE
jgi:hypothetical protein